MADGLATGRQAVARRGGVLLTAELAQAGIRDNTYNGILIRAVLLENGAELGSNRFDFDAHGTVPRTGFVHTLHDLDRIHRSGELDPQPLRSAIGQYLEVYAVAPAEPPPQHGDAQVATRAAAARTTSPTLPLRSSDTTPAPAAPPIDITSGPARRSW
ncbi:hypothetical protein [Kitasatospora sp. NPDC088346]|uniref:hypothetical protein n=1 Tax=Kitasatospora sp. NPDC088346 TaxID=3364073 RepID=UPI00381A6E3C